MFPDVIYPYSTILRATVMQNCSQDPVSSALMVPRVLWIWPCALLSSRLTNLFIIDNGCLRESKHGLMELLLLFMLTDFPSQTSLFFEGREKDFLSCMSSDSLGVEVVEITEDATLWQLFFDVLHAS